MNKQMSHRYEAVEQPEGWAVNEILDNAVVNQTLGLSRRDALYEAVKLNRQILQNDHDARIEGHFVASEEQVSTPL